MEKYEKYNPDEETIEAWLKGFEIRLLCNNITAADRKCNWCRAFVGEAGNSVIDKLPQAATGAEIKAELCSVLGDGEPKKRAFEILSRYKPKSKGLGEMATDIMAKAAIATNDADLQTQLGLNAFLQAVPRSIGRELRRRHFESVGKPWKKLASSSLWRRMKTATMARSSRSRRKSSSLLKSQRLISTK